MTYEWETLAMENALRESCDAGEYLKKYEVHFTDIPIHKALDRLCRQYRIRRKDAIVASHIPKSTAYQIFSGFKNPSRDRLIMLGLGIGITFVEIQSLLSKAGYRRLYPKDKRDVLIAFAIRNSESLVKLNVELDLQKLKPLT